jgi:hypothetical protein
MAESTRNKLIIRISGGIGNQLFQYAFGRALSLKNKCELKLDTHFFALGIEKDRSFKLDNYHIKGDIATDQDFKTLGIPNPKKQDAFSKIVRKVYRTFESAKPFYKRKIILEPSEVFHPELLDIDHSCYLSGVWQSEKYFKAYTDKIRNDFTLSIPLSASAQKLKEIITSVNAVSLHVRRGDQVHNSHLLMKHGHLGDDYYKKAVDHMVKNTDSPHLFIFSDEIDWCKEHLKFAIPVTYIQGADLKDFEELMLMSLCKHNIIAKSSYSWWGAWLNRNPNKIVITPRNRYGENSNLRDTDLIPESWIRV